MSEIVAMVVAEVLSTGLTNEQIQRGAEREFNKRSGLRVGDFIRMPDGKYVRCTYSWDDGMQTTSLTGYYSESFYMDLLGEASYSGALDPPLPWAALHLTEETRLGRFWHFDGGVPRAHGGVNYEIPCRVYEYRP